MTWTHLAGRDRALDGVEEAEELLVAVALHALADHRAFEDVDCSEQGGGAVALVIEGHGPGLASLHRQAGLGSIEGLDLTLLVHRQHDRMDRRIDVQPHDVLELDRELGVLGQLEALDPVRLQAVRGPDPLHRAQRDAGRRGHRPAGPVGRLAGRLAEGQLDHPLDHRLGQWRLARRSALVPQQPVDTLGREPFLPPPDRRLGAAHLAHDPKRAETLPAQQYDPRPFDMLLATIAIRHDRLEPSAIIGGNLDLDPLAHAGTVAYQRCSQGLL
jgi:hypothetical protein